MKSKYFLFFLLFYTTVCFADKLEKGFERLKLFDYFNAKQYFEKSMDDDPAAASYGLAKIFSVNNNPFYSTDSARKYILLSDSLFDIQKEKVKNAYRVLGVTDTTIRELSDFICTDAFNIAQKSGNSSAYNHFISFYNSCAQTGGVIELRNAAAYAEAEKANTSDVFKSFMTSYPLASQFEQAHKKYDELVFEENTDSTIESYQFFIQNFPESPYRKQSEKMIYTLSVPGKTIEQYAQFARTHSNSPHYKEAWHEVYKIGMADFSEQSYINFKSTYPDYPFQEELETDYKLQNTVFLPFEEGGHLGYINDTGFVMIPTQYEEAGMFSEGLAVVALNGKYGYINKAGKLIIDYVFDDAELFHNAAAVVLLDKQYGLIDKDGHFIISPAFEELSEADHDIYMAVKDGKSGYILRTGDTLTGFEFDVANDFKNGYAIVSKDDKMGLIDSTGSFSANPAYDDLIPISDRFIKALNDEKMWGIINVRGDTVLPFDYHAIGEYSEGRALIVRNGKCGYIDEARRQVIPISFPYSSNILTTAQFEHGYALLKQKLKSILIDSTGKQVNFKGVEDYGRPSEGLFPVKKNARWGFADASGKIILPCKYQSAGSFANGLSAVRMNGMMGIIDTTGKEIIPPVYKEIILAETGIVVKNDSGVGLFSRDGAMILSCEFDSVEFIRDDLVKATGKSKYAFVNLNSGKIISSSEHQ